MFAGYYRRLFIQQCFNSVVDQLMSVYLI